MEIKDTKAPITSKGSSVDKSKLGSPLYQMLMLVLSIYVLTTLSVEYFLVSDSEIKSVLQTVDLFICFIFFTDFLYSFFSAPDKIRFMRWGWIDLLSSIPMIDPLRWGRLARIVRVIRIFRVFRSFRSIYKTVNESRFETLTVMTFMIVFFSFTLAAGLILEFERDYESTIKTASDALWWALMNLLNSKIGFQPAISPEGIFTTVLLNKIGLLLFAYLNAGIISWIFSYRNNIQTSSSENT